MQRNDTGITPDGGLYLNKDYFVEDYSVLDFDNKHFFIHEMVHVWQHQLGYPVKWRGAIRIGLSYKYTLSDKKLLNHYNMEAQGDLLADYWSLTNFPGEAPRKMKETKHAKDLLLYQSVLKNFLKNPSDKKNLPGGHNEPREFEYALPKG